MSKTSKAALLASVRAVIEERQGQGQSNPVTRTSKHAGGRARPATWHRDKRVRRKARKKARRRGRGHR